jgi:hypothetical protein
MVRVTFRQALSFYLEKGPMRTNQTTIAWAMIGLASATIAAATVTLAPAQVPIVSPSSLVSVEGDGNVTDTGGPGRIQYLFPASDFAGLPASHRLLVSWNFRGDASQSAAVDWAFDERVWMSTTDKDSLSSVFDDNHGPDKTLVHDGTIAYPILASGPAAGPRDFAAGTRLQTPFFYDPSQGNLLIEEIALSNSVPFPGPHIDFQPTAEVRAVGGSANSASGTPFNGTPIVQFTFVPEPSSLAVAALFLCGLGFFPLRSPRTKLSDVGKAC